MVTTSPAARVTSALAGSGSPFSEVAPGLARLAAGRALRRALAPLGHDREAAVLEHAQLAHHAVAAVVAARAAGAEPQRPALDAQRVAELERLDRRGERVGHRHVDGARAVRVRARALPAADRLVVGEPRVAERDVVHRPLPLRRHGHGLAERAHDDVDDPAGRLDVAGRDRARRARVDERARLERVP